MLLGQYSRVSPSAAQSVDCAPGHAGTEGDSIGPLDDNTIDDAPREIVQVRDVSAFIDALRAFSISFEAVMMVIASL